MKKILASIVLVSFGAFAQSSPEESIELFFQAMHNRDTTALRNLTYGEVVLKSIGKDENGETTMVSQDFGVFLKTLSSTPKKMRIEERLHGLETKTDGRLAFVWTLYSFFVNGKLSHCGANSFQLIRINDLWKVFSIVDTRRKDCEK